jgi:8-oxo-dGTP diphosphatase
MARSPILAAGGIVFRPGQVPLIAVVQLAKDGDWVLPKGKLNPGESARAAAAREVWEETGYSVSVHEFLGKLKYPTGGRQKVVHFWRMEASKKVRDPMDDVREVDWLPLDAALERLTRTHERDFLMHVGTAAHKSRKRVGDQVSIAGSGLDRDSRSPVDTRRPISRLGKPGKRSGERRAEKGRVSLMQKLQNWLRGKFSHLGAQRGPRSTKKSRASRKLS